MLGYACREIGRNEPPPPPPPKKKNGKDVHVIDINV